MKKFEIIIYLDIVYISKYQSQIMALRCPSGVYSVLPTPFKDDESIDYDGVRRWFRYQAYSNDSGPIGLVILGTTSESPNLSREQQMELVRFVSEMNYTHEFPKFLVIGVGGINTKETAEFALQCVDYCDAIMVTVPAYVKPMQTGILKHFRIICNQEPLQNTPVIMYNVPSRTGVNMEPKTMKLVCEECRNVVAVKEASGNISQIMEIRRRIPTLSVFCGDDKLVLDFMLHGACGLISVASNVYPRFTSNLVSLCLDKLYSEASEVFYKSDFAGLCDALFAEGNPSGIKYASYHVGTYTNYKMIGSLVELSEEKRLELIKAMEFLDRYIQQVREQAREEEHEEAHEEKIEDDMPELQEDEIHPAQDPNVSIMSDIPSESVMSETHDAEVLPDTNKDDLKISKPYYDYKSYIPLSNRAISRKLTEDVKEPEMHTIPEIHELIKKTE